MVLIFKKCLNFGNKVMLFFENDYDSRVSHSQIRKKVLILTNTNVFNIFYRIVPRIRIALKTVFQKRILSDLIMENKQLDFVLRQFMPELKIV